MPAFLASAPRTTHRPYSLVGPGQALVFRPRRAPLEGSGAPADAGACDRSRSGWRSRPRHLAKASPHPLRSGRDASRRSTCGVSRDVRAALSVRGPATPVSQLLAPGPSARERSPAIARESGVRCSRPAAPHRSTAGFPRLADPVRLGHISAQSLTAAPSSRRPMSTPLEEQDKRTIYNQKDRSIVLCKEFVLHRRERSALPHAPSPLCGRGRPQRRHQ